MKKDYSDFRDIDLVNVENQLKSLKVQNDKNVIAAIIFINFEY